MKLCGLQFPKSVFVLSMKGDRFLKRKPYFPSETLKALRKTALYLLNIEKFSLIFFSKSAFERELRNYAEVGL